MLEELGWCLFLDVTFFVFFNLQKETFMHIWLIKGQLYDDESLLKNLIGILLINVYNHSRKKGRHFWLSELFFPISFQKLCVS